MAGMRLLRWSVAAALALVSGVALAESDTDQAQRLYDEGVAALEKKYFHTAMDRFRGAELAAHSPLNVLGLARAEAGCGLVVAARGHYELIVDEGVSKEDASPRISTAIEDARREIVEVSARGATVMIAITGPEHPTVTIDHVVLPWTPGQRRPVDPGSHAIMVEATGFKSADVAFSVLEGGVASVTVALAPDSSAGAEWLAPSTDARWPAATAASTVAPAEPNERSAQRTLGYLTLGAAGAGLFTGILGAVITTNKRADVSRDCAGNQCSASAADDLQAARTWNIASVAGFVTAGIGLLGGAALLLTLPKPQTEITPYVGLGTIGAAGRF